MQHASAGLLALSMVPVVTLGAKGALRMTRPGLWAWVLYVRRCRTCLGIQCVR